MAETILDLLAWVIIGLASSYGLRSSWTNQDGSGAVVAGLLALLVAARLAVAL